MIYSELKDDFNAFLKNYGIWIAVSLVVIIVITIVVILLLNKNKKKKPAIEDHTSSSDWLIALGNKENILEVNATGSRLSLKLKDKELIDKEKLKALGVTNILVMSDKVTLVVEDKAELIKEKLN